VTDTRRGLISRWSTGVLVLAIAISGCSTSNGVDGATTRYPDAPIEISKRWWLTPDVARAPDSGDPVERAAALVLQTFFGSDSAEEMAPVSVGPAAVFADFMIVMEEISGRHPMEEVISRKVPRVVGAAGLADLQIEGEITADRSTGAGTANRTTFDDFVMRPGPNGQLRLVDFRRDGTWISELLTTGEDVEALESESGAVGVVAVMRSEIGRYMVAGEISGAAAEVWWVGDAYLESIDGVERASQTLSDLGSSRADGSAPFLITFNDGGIADRGTRLVFPPPDAIVERDLVFEIPSLGMVRDGGEVSGG